MYDVWDKFGKKKYKDVPTLERAQAFADLHKGYVTKWCDPSTVVYDARDNLREGKWTFIGS